MRFRLGLAFLLLTLIAVLPLWIVERPPSQDWPQHVAAVRVLIDHDDPAFGMRDAVEVDLSRTQYVGFYLLAAAFAQLLGPALAVKLLISLVLIAIPYSLRALLRATGGDERYAFFALSLTYSAHVLLGFLSFLAAVPLALFAIAQAARYRRAPSVGGGVALGVLLVCLFYAHVMPYAFALLGVGIALLGGSLRAWLGAGLALAPSLGLTAHWASESEAGHSTLDALRAGLAHESVGQTRFDPFDKTLRELPEWLTDVLHGERDLVLLAASCALLILGGLSLRDRAYRRSEHAPWSARALAVLSPFALLCAFAMPYQHGWIWPIAGRFPYLCLLLLPLLLPRMRARAGDLCALLLAALALAHVTVVALAFRDVEREEARGLSGALASIPDGARVLGLMYQGGSAYVRHFPFMHTHAFAQAEHGGVCMFSFALTSQSPFVYRPFPAGPPPLNLGLGWAPHAADMHVAALYFEYALVRGTHPHLDYVRQYYAPIYEQNAWSLYKRL